ncbi:MAG: translation initiation factor IF-2, partial [Gemmatimonadetes bacterium]|nr:translation initiation factor IF-2 [Gemmatimonadota bacterium]
MTNDHDRTEPALAADAGAGKGGTAKAAKTRIYEIAKEFSVSSEAMLKIVRELGVEVKSHMSSIDADTVDKVRKQFDKEKEAVKEDFARKREVDRKSRSRDNDKKAPAKAAPAPEAKAAPAKTPPAKPARGGKPAPSGRPDRSPPGRRPVDQKVVRANIKKTFADMDKGKRRYRKKEQQEEVQEDAGVLRLTEFVSTAELANSMDVSASQVIAKAMELGSMVTINQRLDKDMIEMLADEFEFTVQFEAVEELETIEAKEDVYDEADQRPRPPVVTIMGHVDHGKTSLLDYIRETNVIAGEAGGITQHIGAYHVELDGGVITFLDTPGHEAFTAMRARGAQITDIVILVVAADDSVMPQTVEAIDHAKAAGVPILVAVNKIDKPSAKPDQVRQELAGRGLNPEEWGGDTIMVDVSALNGTGVDKLLEMVLIQAELMELQANPKRPAKGAIIEARKEKGRGTVVTALVQEGTLNVGDSIVAGTQAVRVRALSVERNHVMLFCGYLNQVGIM